MPETGYDRAIDDKHLRTHRIVCGGYIQFNTLTLSVGNAYQHRRSQQRENKNHCTNIVTSVTRENSVLFGYARSQLSVHDLPCLASIQIKLEERKQRQRRLFAQQKRQINYSIGIPPEPKHLSLISSERKKCFVTRILRNRG